MITTQATPAVSRLWLAGLITILGLVGCSRETLDEKQFLAFGTVVEITLYNADAEQARLAFKTADADLSYMSRAWHPWKAGTLGRMNGLLPTGGSFSAGPSVVPLISKSQTLSSASNGLFNPAIGNLIKLWGFDQDDIADSSPPDRAAIEALLEQHPTMDDIILEGIQLRSTNPAVLLDFGAFAKGYGIGLLMERIKALGIENAIINAGGDLRVIGSRGKRPWRVGIRDPRGTGVIASIETQGDESIFTSGNYERYFDHNGTRYHHIIDPRTGYPAEGMLSVTVIHPDAATADAAATALFIAGPGQWQEIAGRMGIEQIMLVDEEQHVYMTPKMAKRIHFETRTLPATSVVDLGNS